MECDGQKDKIPLMLEALTVSSCQRSEYSSFIEAKWNSYGITPDNVVTDAWRAPS